MKLLVFFILIDFKNAVAIYEFMFIESKPLVSICLAVMPSRTGLSSR
jgi:hypothetical protein